MFKSKYNVISIDALGVLFEDFKDTLLWDDDKFVLSEFHRFIQTKMMEMETDKKCYLPGRD